MNATFGRHTLRVTDEGDSLLGFRARITFPNGHGASVIRGPYTYGGPDGLYEMAVLDPDGRVDYSTPVTDDVIGRLSSDEVAGYLDQIEALP